MNRCFFPFLFSARLRTFTLAAALLAFVGAAAPVQAAVPQGTYHIKKSVVHVNGKDAKMVSSSYGLSIDAEGLAAVTDQIADKLIRACFRSAHMTAAVSIKVTKSNATTLRGQFTGTLADGQHLVSMTGDFFSATLASTGLTVHGSASSSSATVRIIYTFLLKRTTK